MISLSLEWLKALLPLPAACVTLWLAVASLRKEKGFKRIWHVAVCACSFAASLAGVAIEFKRPLPARILSETQVETFQDQLRLFAGNEVVMIVPPDVEARNLGGQIGSSLIAAGWRVQGMVGQDDDRAVVGILIEVKRDAAPIQKSAADTLVNGLTDAKLPGVVGPADWSPNAMAGSFSGYGPMLPNAAIRIAIGSK